jgi:hypothetical protein
VACHRCSQIISHREAQGEIMLTHAHQSRSAHRSTSSVA